MCGAIALALLSSCSNSSSEKRHLTVSVWDYSLISSGYTDYIEEQNPDYDIEWIVGEDDLNFYVEQAEQGSLPDVILVSSFESTEAAKLTDSLLNLKDLEVGAGYSESFAQTLPGNTNDSMKWLFASGSYEGILINSYLFELHDIPVPTDRESFIAACKAFEKKGIRGFVAGYADNATSDKVFQGLAMSSFSSEQGQSWVNAYESGTTQDLDISVWGTALNELSAYIDEGVMKPEDAMLTPDKANKMFINGEAAMVFEYGKNVSEYMSEYNMTVRALPFFVGDQAIAMVDPSFYGAVSSVIPHGVSSDSIDSSHYEAPCEILASIMSEEGQQAYRDAMNVDTAISFNAETKTVLPETLSSIQTCLDEGAVFHPLIDANLEASVADIVRSRMQDLEATDAYSTLTKKLAERKKHQSLVAASYSEGVSNIWSDTTGNEAGSVIAQVVAEQKKADFGILSAKTAQCPLYVGEKTNEQLTFPIPANKVYIGSLTGDEITSLLSECVAEAETLYEVPVVSGLHMVVSKKKNSYELVSVEQIVYDPHGDGTVVVASEEQQTQTQSLDASAEYEVVLSGYNGEALLEKAQEKGILEKLASPSETLQYVWSSFFASHDDVKLPNPESYFELS